MRIQACKLRIQYELNEKHSGNEHNGSSVRREWLWLIVASIFHSIGKVPPILASGEVSQIPVLCGGPHGLAVHQHGVWDLALQHFVHSSTGSTSTLQRGTHPLGYRRLWVSLIPPRFHSSLTQPELNTVYSGRLLHRIDPLLSGPIQSFHSRSRPSSCGPPHTSRWYGSRMSDCAHVLV